jgi:hypothetical protein
MTVSPQFFRSLMLASLAFTILALILDITVPALVPEIVRFAEEQYWNQTSTGGLVFRLVIFILYVVASLVAFVGLYLFKPWARPTNFILAALVIFVSPAMGHVVLSGLAQGLGEIALLLWGAVLALAYFSSISERFKSERRGVSIAGR